MKKREQEALRRLEEALLQPEDVEDELQVAERAWQKTSSSEYDIYNSDITDVDIDSFSEDVHQGRSKRPLPVVFRLLLLGAAVYILLRYVGVI